MILVCSFSSPSSSRDGSFNVSLDKGKMITKNSKNILVADDSVFFRIKLSDILVEAGHRVRFARDGKEVINELRIDPNGIDLLILDLQMPNIDGFGVLKWLNENGYRGKFPVLAVTGVYEPTQVIERIKELGATGLITKGFTPEQIIYRVNRLLFPEKTRERIEPRIPISLPVDFSVGDKTYTGYLLNISASGLFLHTRVALLPGTMVRLRFILPGTNRLMDIKGIVRWSTESDKSRTFFGGCGIMFTSISEEDRRILAEFIKKEIKRLGIEEH